MELLEFSKEELVRQMQEIIAFDVHVVEIAKGVNKSVNDIYDDCLAIDLLEASFSHGVEKKFGFSEMIEVNPIPEELKELGLEGKAMVSKYEIYLFLKNIVVSFDLIPTCEVTRDKVTSQFNGSGVDVNIALDREEEDLRAKLEKIIKNFLEEQGAVFDADEIIKEAFPENDPEWILICDVMVRAIDKYDLYDVAGTRERLLGNKEKIDADI